MNAPDIKYAVDQIQFIALELIAPSKTNPRTRFDPAKLDELATSVKAQGILQPLLVRETKQECFEIIAGERRYRAAKLAGLNALPCFVRNLTDEQVLHAQVIENLQRDDLHPLEEADGYQRMMTEFNATADSMATEIGKSKGYIYGRMKLSALIPEARQAFFDGLLDASTALLVARIPSHKLQAQATKKITEVDQWTGRTMSYRRAKELLQQDYMTGLAEAPFDTKDAALRPDAGACTDCPKRTGNNPDLFGDVKNKDVCTDTVCFAMKKAAHVLVLQKAAEEKGCVVITGGKAKKILPVNRYTSKPEPKEGSGYARLDTPCPHDEQGRTWNQVLGQKAFKPAGDEGSAPVQKVMIEDTIHSKLVPTVNIEAALQFMRDQGMEVKTVKPGQRATQQPSHIDEAKLAKLAQLKATRERLFNTIHQRIDADMNKPQPHFALGLYRILAGNWIAQVGHQALPKLAALYLPEDMVPTDSNYDGDMLQNELIKALEKMTPPQQMLMMIDALMSDELDVQWYNMSYKPEAMLSIAAEIGVNPDVIGQEVAAEIRAAKKVKKPDLQKGGK